MTTQTKKLVDLKHEDWIKLYVISEVNLFETKFNYKFKQQEIDIICKTVADLKLPEGLDVFYAMTCLSGKATNLYLDTLITLASIHDLTLGLDMLVYVYGQFVEAEGYDKEVAHIFKQCLNYTIPF